MKGKLAAGRAFARWQEPEAPRRTAFTLIELLVVIAIISILAAMTRAFTILFLLSQVPGAPDDNCWTTDL